MKSISYRYGHSGQVIQSKGGDFIGYLRCGKRVIKTLRGKSLYEATVKLNNIARRTHVTRTNMMTGKKIKLSITTPFEKDAGFDCRLT